MQKKGNAQGGWWKRLSSFLKSHTSLTVIIAAALLLELTTGVLYYSAQRIIQRTVEGLVQREMNAINLSMRNKLAKVEVTVDNMSWVVTECLADPDWMYDITRRMVKFNPSFLGSGIAFLPDYYAGKDKFYEPYSVRMGGDSIASMQLGSDGVDHTHDDYFDVPVRQERAHWSEPYYDDNGAQTVITTYGVPVRDSRHKVVGVVYADIGLDWLDDIMNEEKAYKSTQRFLVTGGYHLLAGEDCAIYRAALEKLKADKDKKGCCTIDDEQGNKKHVYFTPVGGMTDWMLINALDDSDVFSRLRMIRFSLLLPLMIGFFFAGFIVYRSSRSLERLREVKAEKDRIGGELHVASQIQQNMLPQKELRVEGLELRGFLKPAKEVGGDLYDYFIRDEKLFFCIGDVSGKGAASAMMMAVVQTKFRDFSAHDSNPARIMQNINVGCCQNNKTNMFVTMFIGVLDLPTGRLRYCNAGHDCPFIMHDSQCTMHECKPHLPVGVFDDFDYSVQETTIEPGSTIFLYTDGLTEAKNSGHQFFGLQRVNELLSQSVDLSPHDLLENVTNAVRSFVKDAPQSDDLTMLAIHYTPQQFQSILSETLIIRNDVHEVTKFSEFMKRVTAQLNMEKSLAQQLRLAVEEAVVNVIDYAYPAGQEGEIEIRMMSDGKNLKTIIIDSGVAFDPTAKEKADTSLSAEDRQIGGLGILLVRELMDSINYERTDSKNILTLIKKLPTSNLRSAPCDASLAKKPQTK